MYTYNSTINSKHTSLWLNVLQTAFPPPYSPKHGQLKKVNHEISAILNFCHWKRGKFCKTSMTNGTSRLRRREVHTYETSVFLSRRLFSHQSTQQLTSIFCVEDRSLHILRTVDVTGMFCCDADVICTSEKSRTSPMIDYIPPSGKITSNTCVVDLGVVFDKPPWMLHAFVRQRTMRCHGNNHAWDL